MKPDKQIHSIRVFTVAFITCLALSGITAFPLVSEMSFLSKNLDIFPSVLRDWVNEVNTSIQHTDAKLLYGTDWLAFAHLVIASFFIGVYMNPVRNKFIVQIGMIACLAIFPLAFICGPIRGIPFFHQLIDCSFGVIGLIPLAIIYKKIKQLEHTNRPSFATA